MSDGESPLASADVQELFCLSRSVNSVGSADIDGDFGSDALTFFPPTIKALWTRRLAAKKRLQC